MRLVSGFVCKTEYTVQLVIPDVCAKFQNPKSSSSSENLDEKKITYILTEKATTIYPYILCIPGI